MATGSARHERARRRALRTAGLRPIEVWVPDVHRPDFAEECRRQSRSLRDDPDERELLQRLEAIVDTASWQYGVGKMGLIANWRRRRALHRYSQRLPAELAKNYGASTFYTARQTIQLVRSKQPSVGRNSHRSSCGSAMRRFYPSRILSQRPRIWRHHSLMAEQER